MVGQSKRRVFKTGDSRAMTLPPEFADRVENNEVYVFYDHNMLIVLTEEPSAESFADALMQRLTATEIEA